MNIELQWKLWDLDKGEAPEYAVQSCEDWLVLQVRYENAYEINYQTGKTEGPFMGDWTDIKIGEREKVNE